MAIIATASVSTDAASLHLKKLCRHFQHKVDVDFTDGVGRIDFSVGTCDLNADPGALRFTCISVNKADLEDVKDTMKRHFDRFSEKDGLTLQWDC